MARYTCDAPSRASDRWVVADIVRSTDPLGVMDDLRAQIEATPGVARVTLSTPNRTADTGVVVAIPTTAAGDPATADLVQRIRDEAPAFGEKHDVTVRVAGQTAAQIDVVDGVYHLTQDFPKIKIRPMKSEVVGVVGDGAVEQEMSKYIGRPVKLTIDEVSE